MNLYDMIDIRYIIIGNIPKNLNKFINSNIWVTG